jgi:hypothetical protein
MNIDIQKVTCFDLRPYSEKELTELASLIGVDPRALSYNRKNGVKKVYLIVDEMIEVATIISENSPFSKTYTTYKGLKTEFPLSRREINKLLNLKPFDFREFKKRQKRELHEQRVLDRKNSFSQTVDNSDSNFDLDTILDKISTSGITSLSRSEKEFLDNLSK